jgi:N-acetylmuramoyl-L-alanine amidase
VAGGKGNSAEATNGYKLLSYERPVGYKATDPNEAPFVFWTNNSEVLPIDRPSISKSNGFQFSTFSNYNPSVLDDPTLDPVLYPHKSDARVQTICLDPGHGGKDSGKAQGHNYEKKYTLLLARETEDLLKEQGFKVVMTRTSDEMIELPDRPQIAASKGADLFVSMHYNAADSGVHGVEVFCMAPPGINATDDGGGKSYHPTEPGNAHDDRNVLLAYNVQKSITHSLPLEDLGLKRSHFEVLRLARMPAILVEGGFLSNPADARNIYDSAFRKRMAKAIVDGIVAYKRAVSQP